jgi:hypothetical protein
MPEQHSFRSVTGHNSPKQTARPSFLDIDFVRKRGKKCTSKTLPQEPSSLRYSFAMFSYFYIGIQIFVFSLRARNKYEYF